MSSEQWVVGAEHDAAQFERLGCALRSLGYDIETHWSGFGGSQQVSRWELIGPKGVLVVEAETYIGLHVTGVSELVSELRSSFHTVGR
jgi:hypothetical protein